MFRIAFIFAWRYIWYKKNISTITIILWISVVAICIGTAALIIIMSVFNGFEILLKSLYHDFYSDIKITSTTSNYFPITEKMRTDIRHIQYVVGISSTIETKGMLSSNKYQNIVNVNGVDSNYLQINHINVHIENGTYDLGSVNNPNILMGIGIASTLGVNVDNHLSTPLTLYLPNRVSTSNINMENAFVSYLVTPSGLFAIQQDLDNSLVFTNVSFLQYMLSLPSNYCNTIHIKANEEKNIIFIKKQLQHILGSGFQVIDRYEQNPDIYRVITSERWSIYIILCFIMVLSSFTLIGSLTILILEKEKDIAILRSLGASFGLIRAIFLCQGLCLSILGCVIGMVIGGLVCFLQIYFHLIPLSGNSFIISYYPVALHIFDFINVLVTVIVISIFAILIPLQKIKYNMLSLKSS